MKIENVSEVIRNRTVVRQFKPDVIPDDILSKILDAARWAPSPFNTQPWEFVIIKDKETLKSIARYARYSGYLENAPMALAVVVPPLDGKFSWINSIGEPRYAAASAEYDVAAWELGIGTCWVSIEREKVSELLKVPGTHFVLTVIPVGYPETTPPKHDESSRKKLKDMIFYEKYGKKSD